MGKIRSGFKQFTASFKDYCLNSSLAGVGYLANEKYHITERIFWLICISISTIGSYYLIKEYRDSFESNAISLVLEDIRPMEKVEFPSVGICELGNTKGDYGRLEEFVNSLKQDETWEYNYQVDDYLARIVYQNIYSPGMLNISCSPFVNCNDCIKCPESGYREISEFVRANCTELFKSCSWNGKAFDCCQYFLPIQTSMGKCYLLNSIQTTKKYGKHWLDTSIGFDIGNGLLYVEFRFDAAIHILNEEDVPHILLSELKVVEENAPLKGTIRLSVQNIINDNDVRDINPNFRECYFPDEVPDPFTYKYYSFSSCVTECLKQAQLKACNCTNYNLIVDEADKSPRCDMKGFLCLDSNELIYPRTTIMQPWRANGLRCKCLPSCTEHEIRLVEETLRINREDDTRSITITLQSLPTERYRRQTVRNQMDVVVSIGGILSLFMGASILSALEILYFFTTRLIGNVQLRKEAKK